MRHDLICAVRGISCAVYKYTFTLYILAWACTQHSESLGIIHLRVLELSRESFGHFDHSSYILRNQEPITRSLHLPYKPYESTFARISLFLETVGLLDWRALYAKQYNVIQYDTAGPFPWLEKRPWERRLNLRGTLLPRVFTTSFGLQSFRYAAPQARNSLPDGIRPPQSLIDFKRPTHNITVLFAPTKG